MDYSEKWGKDVEEATRLALIDLRLTADQVNVIVLEEPTKGFLGLGAKLAKVRVEKKPDTFKAEEKKQEEKIQKSTPSYKPERVERPERSDRSERPEKTAIRKESDRRDNERKPERREKRTDRVRPGGESTMESSFSVREKPADLVELKDHVSETFLNEITDKMGLKLKIKVFGNDSCIYIDMDGKDSGTIIGKRGQTLDAIQYLTSLVVNKDKEKYLRVVVDAENYREKRERTLEQLANRLADKVIKSRKSVRLEPMNPYERKVIHATLQSNPKVTTRSEGDEPYRRVIIELK
ncbi:protein jag [Anoxybacterium hadale]|uniref:Protein jag n=1 Tax=Anoxybacterium hadale TaxID=3408580 RepID=A0ACD1AEU5_9FIRM|nr:protein jag [Clostridiales bacterium]